MIEWVRRFGRARHGGLNFARHAFFSGEGGDFEHEVERRFNRYTLDCRGRGGGEGQRKGATIEREEAGGLDGEKRENEMGKERESTTHIAKSVNSSYSQCVWWGWRVRGADGGGGGEEARTGGTYKLLSVPRPRRTEYLARAGGGGFT